MFKFIKRVQMENGEPKVRCTVNIKFENGGMVSFTESPQGKQGLLVMATHWDVRGRMTGPYYFTADTLAEAMRYFAEEEVP